MVPDEIGRVLDVGCGDGEEVRLLRAAYPGIKVVGLTHNAEEADVALAHMNSVHVIALEHTGCPTQRAGGSGAVVLRQAALPPVIAAALRLAAETGF